MANSERDAEEDHDRFGDVADEGGRVVGSVVDERDKDGVGTEALGELDDDGELVDEEMVGAVHDKGEVVERSRTGEVAPVIFPLLYTERPRQGRACRCSPSIKSEQLVDGSANDLLVEVVGVGAEDEGLLEAIPKIFDAVLDVAVKEVGRFVAVDARLEEGVLASVESLAG